MIVHLANMGTLLTLNLLFATLALAVGFAAGVWFFGAGDSPSQALPHPPDHSDDEIQRAAERAMMASQRIQDLAKGMASDVGAHASKVEAITADLQSMASDHTGGPDDVYGAISRIVDANSQLQQRLAVAEKHIEDQAAELRTYETEARTDSLTGLANRRAFDDEMQRRFAEWKRRKTPFTLMILDIDHFKQFNDSHGHQAGDDVLRSVGKVLVRTARQMDLPCRYGGEEFAVILPGTAILEARPAAERFRKAIESLVVKTEGKKLSVTSSIGVAQVGDQDDAPQLIRRADEALYRSKEAGRNCGHWHDGERCLPVAPAAASPVHPAESGSDGSALVDRLPNQATFLDVLQRRVTESQRFGIPLSLLHLRAEDFQSISREYGRSIAHLTLDSVAQYTQSALREMDFLARLQDGDFIALLPGSTLTEAAQVARRLQSTAANCAIPLGDQKVQLRLTHGIAQLLPNETAMELMARAKAETESAPADCPVAST